VTDPIVNRILIIDDNPAIHADFRKVLTLGSEAGAEAVLATLEADLFGVPARIAARPTFEIDSAHQGREGVERVRAALAAGRPYAMAFVDMRMPPGWDGLETIEHLWAVDPNVQIVICSAHTDYDWTEVVDRLNQSDKLLVLRKPAEPIEVLQCAAALTRKWDNERVMRAQVVRLQELLSDRTRGLETANRQLRHLATHDALTGLPNRALLDDRMQQAATYALRKGRPVAMMVCNIDRFKLLNDSLGSRGGDELLQEVARRLQSAVRGIDTVARVGGDEFVLLLNSVHKAEDARRVALQAVDLVRMPIRIAGVDVHASLCVGIACYPDDAATMDGLIGQARAAVAVAKQQGRGQVQVYAPGMNTATQGSFQLESDLHRALELGQFELYYQPRVNTATGAVRGAEALIRWIHPDRGMIAPDEFIPVAEECGLIGPIGEWVLREACRQARAWQDGEVGRLRISVNLSPLQFRQSSIIQVVRDALSQSGLAADCLELELTESAVMSDPEESIAVLEQLSATGVLVSVDDFGTGYSSMSYLSRFPIDILKIDRIFISEIASRSEDASIVRAIVSLAHSLKLKVVAEGVETQAQLEFLKSLGCDEYQGYAFSRPVPAAAFAEVVAEARARSAPQVAKDAPPTHGKLAARKARR
jgi:diguanylate cyclase (GGDEF)-like protein